MTSVGFELKPEMYTTSKMNLWTYQHGICNDFTDLIKPFQKRKMMVGQDSGRVD
jgi:hypothetical protein